MYMWVRTVTAGETNCRYQKTVTREQGKITVNGNPASTGGRDGNGEGVLMGMDESHTAHNCV